MPRERMERKPSRASFGHDSSAPLYVKGLEDRGLGVKPARERMHRDYKYDPPSLPAKPERERMHHRPSKSAPEVRRLGFRKPFEATEEQRRFVELAVANGAKQASIADMIVNPASGEPIGLATLKNHFRKELDTGHDRHRLRVASSAFRQAVGAPAEYDDDGNMIQPPIAPNPTMTKWYEQSRFGLKEGTQIQVIDADGNPVNPGGGNTTINQVIFMLPQNGYETKPMKDVTPQQEALPAPQEVVGEEV